MSELSDNPFKVVPARHPEEILPSLLDVVGSHRLILTVGCYRGIGLAGQ